MYVERHRVTLTTAADGSATGYTPVVTGRALQIVYTKTDFSDGVDFAVTGETSGVNIWTEDNVNATATRAPRQATHSTAGVAALYAVGGVAVLDRIAVAQERVKIAVTNGGATKTGTFDVYVG